ncbi:multidrug ABC transporter permease [Candidatus Phycorickettsia trachydisci]|uniref:Transport permease protein n=1 Tax=Candidatus Phycorickettsia trachydisci TaxID=2115978 RepID=A0A2P1PA63_9RICK|nr:ABC transporter permease [Candidatus Phycorickettsia trachydisci]AVP88157.1 multidrug ABC transporter permease [Candidatus Phycorickettsia trachydisci]
MNLYGLYVLYLKETKRFLKVYNQTIITPAVSSLLLLAVLVLATSHTNAKVKGIDFEYFIGCGLIIMSILQNSFANSSSSLIMAKVIGYITDLLIPPFQGFEIVTAYTLGAITRGILVGCMVAMCLYPLIKFQVHSLGYLLFFSFAASMLMGLVGILTGLISETFDQNTAMTNYVIGPLSFLSGTFYSIEKLPHFFQIFNHFNPFFYMIDGFRYSLTGVHDSNIHIGVAILISFNTILFLVLKHLIDIGWKLKN